MIRQVHSQVSSELCRQQLLQVQGWDHFGLHLREGIEAGWRSRDKIGLRNEAGDKKLSEARRKKSFVLPLLGGSDGKESLCNVGDLGLIPGLGRIAWRRKWQPTPVFWPGESYGLRCLVGYSFSSIQFSSFQLLSHVRLFGTPWIAARQASLSITNSRSSPKLTSIESVMPSSHLILCCPLLLLPPIPPSIRVFSNESSLRMRWPKYWSFSFSIRPSKEYPGLISFRMDWLELLAVQGTLKSLL